MKRCIVAPSERAGPWLLLLLLLRYENNVETALALQTKAVGAFKGFVQAVVVVVVVGSSLAAQRTPGCSVPEAYPSKLLRPCFGALSGDFLAEVIAARAELSRCRFHCCC